MGKRLLEWWGRLKEWTGEQATTAFWVFLSVFSVLLLWVMFGDKIGYNGCWIYEGLGVADKTEAIKILGLAIAGVMAAGGVVAAGRRADAMATTAMAAEVNNRQQAFNDGVEHLGSDKEPMRQGGAHALFYLAMDDKTLRVAIVSFLCAHIRATTIDKGYQEKYKYKPSTEMQSLLRLLFTAETVDEGGASKVLAGHQAGFGRRLFLWRGIEKRLVSRGQIELGPIQGGKTDWGPVPRG